MYYTVYKITNLVNNKIYIGMHQTNDLEDDYMGSGLYLNRAKEQYGLENFIKEYLYFLDSYEEMCNKEKELVNKDFLLREDVYNLNLGGEGGFHYINTNSLNNNNKTKEELAAYGYNTWKKAIDSGNYIELCNKISNGVKLSYQLGNRKIGGCCSDPEIRKIMSERANTTKAMEKRKNTYRQINHQQGINNSMYGTVWCVLKNAIDITDRIRFNKNNIPTEYISTTEWTKLNKAIKRQEYLDTIVCKIEIKFINEDIIKFKTIGSVEKHYGLGAHSLRGYLSGRTKIIPQKLQDIGVVSVTQMQHT